MACRISLCSGALCVPIGLGIFHTRPADYRQLDLLEFSSQNRIWQNAGSAQFWNVGLGTLRRSDRFWRSGYRHPFFRSLDRKSLAADPGFRRPDHRRFRGLFCRAERLYRACRIQERDLNRRTVSLTSSVITDFQPFLPNESVFFTPGDAPQPPTVLSIPSTADGAAGTPALFLISAPIPRLVLCPDSSSVPL